MTNARHSIARLLFIALALLAGAFPLTASAVVWSKNTDFLWNATTGRLDFFPGPGSGNVWGTGKTGTGPNGPYWSKTKELPFNPSPAANFKANFSAAGMAKSLSPVSAAANLVGAAIVYKAISEACLAIGGTPTDGHFWQECTYGNETIDEWRGALAPTVLTVGPASTWSGIVEQARARMQNELGVPVFVSSQNESTKLAVITRSDMGGYYIWSFSKTSTVVPSSGGFQRTTQEAAQNKLTQKLGEWCQADFTSGRNAGDCANMLNELVTNGPGVDVSSIFVDGPGSITTPTTTKVDNITTYSAPSVVTTESGNRYGLQPNTTITLTNSAEPTSVGCAPCTSGTRNTIKRTVTTATYNPTTDTTTTTTNVTIDGTEITDSTTSKSNYGYNNPGGTTSTVTQEVETTKTQTTKNTVTGTSTTDTTTTKSGTPPPVAPTPGTGTVVTKLNPDGSTTVSTTVGTTTTHVTTWPDGSKTTGTSTTGTTTVGQVPGSGWTPSEQPTDCDKIPDAMGCSKFGNVTDGPGITKTNKQVTILSKTFAGGSCPQPVSFTVFATTHAFSYQPLCDKLAAISGILMALAAIASAWIFADGFRVT